MKDDSWWYDILLGLAAVVAAVYALMILLTFI